MGYHRGVTESDTTQQLNDSNIYRASSVLPPWNFTVTPVSTYSHLSDEESSQRQYVLLRKW